MLNYDQLTSWFDYRDKHKVVCPKLGEDTWRYTILDAMADNPRWWISHCITHGLRPRMNSLIKYLNKKMSRLSVCGIFHPKIHAPCGWHHLWSSMWFSNSCQYKYVGGNSNSISMDKSHSYSYVSSHKRVILLNMKSLFAKTDKPHVSLFE